MQIARDVRATHERVWEVLTDVRRWPEWTPSITGVEVLGGGPLGPGSHVRIAQPKLPPAVWIVAAYEPGWSFRWQSGRTGVTTVAEHRVEPAGPNSRLVLTVRQTGPLALATTLLTSRLTRRYVTLEADGLRGAAEA